MASSNRHWPSMFKSKPCNQWQNDLNSSLTSNGCHRSSPYTSGPGCEERTPEPKPRWNPKPEQIRILEAIFDSGMVNPPRDEIRKIRAQLQEYGQVGDANVFYWFQNRKSRSKQKLRHLQNSKKSTQNPNPNPNPNLLMSSSASASVTPPPPSSSSSSSDKSSPSAGSHKTNLSLNSPTGSINQTYFHHHNQAQGGDFMSEPTTFLFAPQHGINIPPFSEVQNIGPCTSLLFNEMMMVNNMSSNHSNNNNNNNSNNHDNDHSNSHVGSEKIDVGQSDHEKFVKLLQMQKNHLGLINTPVSTHHHSTVTTTTSVGLPALASNTSQIQGVAEAGSMGPTGNPAAKSTVFINEVAFEVPVSSFNLREAFGEGAMLINAASGQPVLTNEWGLTVQPLQHGASYYLI